MKAALSSPILFLAVTLAVASPARAQDHDHSMMLRNHAMSGMHVMGQGFYGPYPMTREASGTAWQPDSTPHDGLHQMAGDWLLMFNGFVNGIYDHQYGPRGFNKFFSNSMWMTMAQHPLGPGTFGFRNMLSLDPAMGASGYPLLLQTGESADGRTRLIDRQHPHDLFMELAASYSIPLGGDKSLFTYLGLPGEPALGPATFMHRFSGVDNPAAPITHHWFDSTHITFGVATAGLVWNKLKLEGSAFNGREPDQYRWDIEEPKLNSYAGRLTFNPAPNWSLQSSWGYLHRPEALEPDNDQHRFTTSATYNKPLADGNWQSSLAWGQNNNSAGPRLDAWSLESAIAFSRRYTIFARAERVQKNELFQDLPRSEQIFNVGEATLGYIRDFDWRDNAVVGLGALGTIDFLPASLESTYGKKTPISFMLFIRAKLIQPPPE